MATGEQIENILEKMEKIHPIDFFNKVDKARVGIGAVLRLLNESNELNESVTAGRISDVMNVSTARVAVLLKKMAAKGLVTREKSAEDGRVTVVTLTELGKKTVSEIQADRCAQAARIIDAVGEERISEFIAIAYDIKAAFKEPDFKF